ncbi:uncharacterized protein A1O9_07237 [Exophiala aquamarina CBS 119918]|uniref:Cyclohexanone monooxygenase n=1 Tax=Exophiala aquamarina CBS 119918 TaxID=1182545 RepID=A0A072PB95_9EURO|nr:uncharacterized protein A1O9_07237 [Exophiala aquamarina CBS 119918]KEF57047.1 hypothetical protein A1O9_07237 [Exophiala aquamarina CBS 119918]
MSVNGIKHTVQGSPAPIFSPQHVSVVCIGAGVSGIALAIEMHQKLQNFDLCIFEKNSDIGGTWLENRYPGCACDVPAHAYTYTFEPNPEYSQYYVGSEEIHQYLTKVVEKYGVRKYIRFNHKLVSAVWSNERGQWDLELEAASNDGSRRPQIVKRSSNFLINASGFLNNWKWPEVPGLHDFAGPLIHSADWQKDQELAKKTVAVIGAGSSGIQIVPALQPKVGKLYAFIRSPTWIPPSQGFVDPINGGHDPTNLIYTDEDKKRFREDPKYFLEYRKTIESNLNRIIDMFFKDSPRQAGARQEFAKIMRARLGGNEAIASKLIPQHSVGCRRLTPGQGFLEALIERNVEVVTSEIQRIEAEGLVTADGKLHKVDAIICATGFDTSCRPRFRLVGDEGIILNELWDKSDCIEAYLAMAVPGFSNYLMFIGPNAPISNGTLIPVIERQASYMSSMIRKYQRQHIKSFSPLARATRLLNQRHQQRLQRFVWTDSCKSWYKNGQREGKVIGPWPGSSLHYFEAISEPKFEDWWYSYWESKGDSGIEPPGSGMWEYLGNGYTMLEAEDEKSGGKGDLAWYLG